MKHYLNALDYILRHPEETEEAQQGRLAGALITDAMQELVDRLEGVA